MTESFYFRFALMWVSLCGFTALSPRSSPAASVQFELESFSFELSKDHSLELKFSDSQSIQAMDEFGRRCTLHSGTLIPFSRSGEELWRLENSGETGGSFCLDGMIFKINASNGRFTRAEHGFREIFKYYASQSCSAVDGIDLPPPRTNLEKPPKGRPLTNDETQMLYDCFIKRDKWATVKALFDWYMQVPDKKYALRELCTKHLLVHLNQTVICSSGFKKLGDDSVFLDVVVLKEGQHVIRGGGSGASTYILHPDFKGSVDLAGHSRVYHLPGQRCLSEDIFRGCVNTTVF